jgi:hypothetical protein
VYCPTGSAAPTPVSPGYYSTPLTNPVTTRFSQTQCPPDRLCTNGVLSPGLVFAGGCSASGMATAVAIDGYVNQAFGPQVSVTTPGYTGAVTFTVTSISNADPTCTVTPGFFSWTNAGLTAAQLNIGASPVRLTLCPNGFTVMLTAARSVDSSLFAQCSMSVSGAPNAASVVLPRCVATYLGCTAVYAQSRKSSRHQRSRTARLHAL